MGFVTPPHSLRPPPIRTASRLGRQAATRRGAGGDRTRDRGRNASRRFVQPIRLSTRTRSMFPLALPREANPVEQATRPETSPAALRLRPCLMTRPALARRPELVRLLARPPAQHGRSFFDASDADVAASFLHARPLPMPRTTRHVPRPERLSHHPSSSPTCGAVKGPSMTRRARRRGRDW